MPALELQVEAEAARVHYEEQVRAHYAGLLREREALAEAALAEREAAEEARRRAAEAERIRFEEQCRKKADVCVVARRRVSECSSKETGSGLAWHAFGAIV